MKTDIPVIDYFFFPKKKLTNFFGTVEKVFLFFFFYASQFSVFTRLFFGHEHCNPPASNIQMDAAEGEVGNASNPPPQPRHFLLGFERG